MSKINIVEIVKWCADMRILVEKLQSFGIILKEVQCSTCEKQMKLSFSDDGNDAYWLCRNYYINSHRKRMKCNQKTSIKSMTIFNSANLNYQQILIALHECCNYSEVRKMCLEASIDSSRTAAKWNAFFNEIVVNSCFQHSTAIGE